MGRPFTNELSVLEKNIAFALDHPVDELAAALNALRTSRIVVCGAGGSFSAAAFAQLLFQTVRMDVQMLTPLGFLESERPIEPTSLILFTAGGRNKDVLRVIEHARNSDIRVLLVCATKDSPAARLAKAVHSNKTFDFSYPAARDGFLAVNSLVVTWWLLARAFGIDPPRPEVATETRKQEFDLSFVSPDRRHAFVLLHDRWTRPVAIDLESKFSEAALSAPLVSDWRQFGHGRHHWLAKNDSFSSVLALRNPESRVLADRTLRLLPRSIRRSCLTTETPTIPGVCHLLLQSFAFVGALGRRVGIDPGRPGVPSFGSALYHLAPPRTREPRRERRWDAQLAAERKIDAIGISRDDSITGKIVRAAASRYVESLRQCRFGAVVLDFDGTAAASGILPDKPLDAHITATLVRLLKKRIIIGIATGRGDSCHHNLTKSIPEALWSNVYVCHYNGASVGNLEALAEKGITWSNDPLLVDITEELTADPLISRLADIRLKGPQITLRGKERADVPVIEKSVRTMLSQRHCRTARLVVSSHTLDIVPKAATKVALIEYIRDHHVENGQVLAIGDRGDEFGNDFELLSTPFSLSVDRVSTSLDSCWNFLPRGVSHETGTVLYLERLRFKTGGFQLDLT